MQEFRLKIKEMKICFKFYMIFWIKEFNFTRKKIMKKKFFNIEKNWKIMKKKLMKLKKIKKKLKRDWKKLKKIEWNCNVMKILSIKYRKSYYYLRKYKFNLKNFYSQNIEIKPHLSF